MAARVARLRNELAVILAIKVVLLAMIWAFFVHGSRVAVNPENMAQHALQTQAVSEKGKTNGN